MLAFSTLIARVLFFSGREQAANTPALNNIFVRSCSEFEGSPVMLLQKGVEIEPTQEETRQGEIIQEQISQGGVNKEQINKEQFNQAEARQDHTTGRPTHKELKKKQIDFPVCFYTTSACRHKSSLRVRKWTGQGSNLLGVGLIILTKKHVGSKRLRFLYCTGDSESDIKKLY